MCKGNSSFYWLNSWVQLWKHININMCLYFTRFPVIAWDRLTNHTQWRTCFNWYTTDIQESSWCWWHGDVRLEHSGHVMGRVNQHLSPDHFRIMHQPVWNTRRWYFFVDTNILNYVDMSCRSKIISNSSSRLTTKKTPKPVMTGPLWGKLLTDRFPHRGPVMRKVFPRDQVIMNEFLFLFYSA